MFAIGLGTAVACLAQGVSVLQCRAAGTAREKWPAFIIVGLCCCCCCCCCFCFVQAQLILYKQQLHKIGATDAAVKATLVGKPAVAPEVFWKNLQPHCPELAPVAQMLLVIIPASATSERVYSSVCSCLEHQAQPDDPPTCEETAVHLLPQGPAA